MNSFLMTRFNPNDEARCKRRFPEVYQFSNFRRAAASGDGQNLVFFDYDERLVQRFLALPSINLAARIAIRVGAYAPARIGIKRYIVSTTKILRMGALLLPAASLSGGSVQCWDARLGGR